MPFFRIGEHRLAYRLKRDGSDGFVFVHGLGASKNSFDRCFDMADFKGYTLAALDLPGCGESSRPERFSFTMKAQAGLAAEWISSLAVDRIILAGHSMGGVICLYLAETLGPRVKMFFNLEGNLDYQDCTYSGQIAATGRQYFESKGFGNFKKRLKQMAQANPSPGLLNYCKNISRVYPAALYLSSVSLVEESRKGGLKEKFAALPMKKCYAFGERSLNKSSKIFLDASRIPYFIVPDSGHFMMDDQPDLFYSMLFEALKDRRPCRLKT